VTDIKSTMRDKPGKLSVLFGFVSGDECVKDHDVRQGMMRDAMSCWFSAMCTRPDFLPGVTTTEASNIVVAMGAGDVVISPTCEVIWHMVHYSLCILERIFK
jgi:hypothetical protein